MDGAHSAKDQDVVEKQAGFPKMRREGRPRTTLKRTDESEMKEA